EYRAAATFRDLDHGLRTRINEALYHTMLRQQPIKEPKVRRVLGAYLDTHLYAKLFTPEFVTIMQTSRAMFEHTNSWTDRAMNGLLSGSDADNVYIQDGARKGYAGSPSIPKWRWKLVANLYNSEYVLSRDVYALSLVLSAFPALAQTGQLDPIYDRPR